MPGTPNWTTPRDWTNEELVTADIMNTHIRDMMLYLFVMQSYLLYT